MNKKQRKKTREINAGGLRIGGTAPVSIQTMTNIPIERTAETIEQINACATLGADLVRVAVKSIDAAEYLKIIIPASNVPLCADIHFDYRIALAAIKAGIHKVRLNPGNIGDAARVREVVSAAKEHGVPIRIGVNGGSLDRKKYPSVTPENIAASALEHVGILEDAGFTDIAVSLKSSDIRQTIESYEIFSEQRDYPLHVGLTEAGYGLACAVQSSVAIGHLLMKGIGDTIRVSMTGDPKNEIIVAKKILESVGERVPRIRLISCPTCGRTDPGVDVLALAEEADRVLAEKFEKRLDETGKSITVAVMGCEVNGPGEAKHADAGLAGARNGRLLLFSRGEKVKNLGYDEAITALCDEIEKLI